MKRNDISHPPSSSPSTSSSNDLSLFNEYFHFDDYCKNEDLPSIQHGDNHLPNGIFLPEFNLEWGEFENSYLFHANQSQQIQPQHYQPTTSSPLSNSSTISPYLFAPSTIFIDAGTSPIFFNQSYPIQHESSTVNLWDVNKGYLDEKLDERNGTQVVKPKKKKIKMGGEDGNANQVEFMTLNW